MYQQPETQDSRFPAPPDTINPSSYLDRQEASRYLNLPPSWLANNTHRGPRFVKVGRHVRYAISALDSFMNAHEVRFG